VLPGPDAGRAGNCVRPGARVRVGGRKLTDFGIAARAGDSPVAAGTLAYAPPEQFAGSPASPATDVYAATATFYECLTGRPPFTGDTAEVLLRQHQAAPVPLEPVPEPLFAWPEPGRDDLQ
jgi:serine/threonine protein kinase